MEASLCKLCLFKSEPQDEIIMEESEQLQTIIDEIFHKMISLSKLELDVICTPCREKLKSFHEYYKFVLNNQTAYHSIPFDNTKRSVSKSEFISVIKDEPTDAEDTKPVILDGSFKDESNSSWTMDCDPELVKNDEPNSPPRTRRKKTPVQKKTKRVQKPRCQVVALQEMQCDFITTLFDMNCAKCGLLPAFKTYLGLYKHTKKRHHTQKVWTCCGKEMKKDLDLIAHILEHKNTWECEPCNLKFQNVLDHWKHRTEKHLKPYIIEVQDPNEWLKLQYDCDICSERFRTLGLIGQHMKDVHIRNSTCNICGATFFNKKLTSQHKWKAHSSVLKLPCSICGVMISRKSGLMEAHIRNTHSTQYHICAQCGKMCKSDCALRQHMIRTHQPPKYKCSFCMKLFKTRTFLLDHEAIHTGIPRYICNICGAQFKSNGNYTAHMRRLHPVEYENGKIERQAKRYQE